MSPSVSRFHPLVTNGLSHPYHLYESTFNSRGIRSNFSFLFQFSMKFMLANRIASDGTPCFATSHLGLFCLPMSHKRDARYSYGLKQLGPIVQSICSLTRQKRSKLYKYNAASVVWGLYIISLIQRRCIAEKT